MGNEQGASIVNTGGRKMHITLTENEIRQIGSTLSAKTDWANDDFSAYMRNRFTGFYGKGDQTFSVPLGEVGHIVNALSGMILTPVVGESFRALQDKLADAA
jgi:hypothetical protein